MNEGGARQTEAVGGGSRLTLVDVLRERATLEPDRIAYTFLVDGEDKEQSLTYADLDRQARRIAAALRADGVATRRALLVYPPGLDFVAAFLGCLYAGIVAVPMYPPSPPHVGAGVALLQRVAADACASLVLTTRAFAALAGGWGETVAPDLIRLRWIMTDARSAGGEIGCDRVDLAPDTLAFLQYTSGSTGTPKGVMVTHGNIVEHGRCVQAALQLTQHSVAVGWLPLYHDMGLIGTVLLPLQVGFRSVLMSPLAFLERPLRWLRALSRCHGTLSPAPNFAYDLCVRKTTPAERLTLDLSRWRAAMNGAEPVRQETLERFTEVFAPCGFRAEAFVPCYGLAEATLMVAGGPVGTAARAQRVDAAALDAQQVAGAVSGDRGGRIVVGCGEVIPDHRVAIVSPEALTEHGPGTIGEIWVAGPSVAAGYWRLPEETAAAFGACLADTCEGPFLRTGDLGFVRDGTVFVTGRRKDLIIIRGRNYYPQDIEHTVERAHPALRPGCGAAFSVDHAGQERLVVVQEICSTDTLVIEEATDAVRNAVACEHEIHTHAVILVRPRTIPKTSSGKIRRRECRAEFAAGTLAVVGSYYAVERRADDAAPDCHRGGEASSVSTTRRADIEQRLVRKVAELRDMLPDEIGRDQPFVALGIDSAEAAEVAAELEEWLGCPVPLTAVFEHPTIAALAARLARGA
jgi:acyl-CoA synthetase (AMP-forming)/AMP-acid ligase II/acyl carrier protein